MSPSLVQQLPRQDFSVWRVLWQYQIKKHSLSFHHCGGAGGWSSGPLSCMKLNKNKISNDYAQLLQERAVCIPHLQLPVKWFVTQCLRFNSLPVWQHIFFTYLWLKQLSWAPAIPGLSQTAPSSSLQTLLGRCTWALITGCSNGGTGTIPFST